MDAEHQNLSGYIEVELDGISNERVLTHVRGLLVQPKPKFLNWDYGEVDRQHLCWIVLEESDGRCGIAYCNEGFGPKNPWGLVFLEDKASMGMDSAWFPTFMEAYIESAAADIPIWCIVKKGANGLQIPITSEGEWDEIWAQTMALRRADPQSQYDVETLIVDKPE